MAAISQEALSQIQFDTTSNFADSPVMLSPIRARRHNWEARAVN